MTVKGLQVREVSRAEGAEKIEDNKLERTYNHVLVYSRTNNLT